MIYLGRLSELKKHGDIAKQISYMKLPNVNVRI